jgi:hypothetical protein
MTEHFDPAAAASLHVHPMELATIVAAAFNSVHSLLDAIEIAAEAGKVYAEPWLMLSHLDHAIGERDDIRTLAATIPGSKLIELEPWVGASARRIARVIDGDAEGRFFKGVLDLAIILRARHARGEGNARLETFDVAGDALQEVAVGMVIKPQADPYVVLTSADADLGLPESREAVEVIDFAVKVVTELYQKLDRAVDEGKVYDHGFMLMAFDNISVGDPPEVGLLHLDASVAPKVGAVMRFGRTISAAEVLRAFRHEEMELRVHLVTALICLRQLHERGRNRSVKKELDEQIATIRARLWYGANAS